MRCPMAILQTNLYGPLETSERKKKGNMPMTRCPFSNIQTVNRTVYLFFRFGDDVKRCL